MHYPLSSRFQVPVQVIGMKQNAQLELRGDGKRGGSKPYAMLAEGRYWQTQKDKLVHFIFIWKDKRADMKRWERGWGSGRGNPTSQTCTEMSWCLYIYAYIRTYMNEFPIFCHASEQRFPNLFGLLPPFQNNNNNNSVPLEIQLL